jgi:hypothetical protein
MNKEIEKLKKQAFYYRDLLKLNAVNYNTAKEKIMPWINEFNKIAKEKSKRYNIKSYNIKSYNISFTSFVRQNTPYFE